MGLLNHHGKHFKNLLKVAVVSNIHVESSEGSTKEAVVKEVLDDLEALIPEAAVATPDVFNAKTMSNTPAMLLAHFRQAYEHAVEEFVYRVRDALERGVERQIFGKITFYSEADFEYFFYRWRVSRTFDGTHVGTTQQRGQASTNRVNDPNDPGAYTDTTRTPVTTTTTTERDYLTTRTRERHEHHVYDGKSEALPADTVPKQSFVRYLLKHSPKVFLPYLRVASEEMVREKVEQLDRQTKVDTDKEVRSETVMEERTYVGRRYSPTVTFGGYTLTGWSGGDLKREQDARAEGVVTVAPPAKQGETFPRQEHVALAGIAGMVLFAVLFFISPFLLGVFATLTACAATVWRAEIKELLK